MRILLRCIFAVVDGFLLPHADYEYPDINNAYYDVYNCCFEVTHFCVHNLKRYLIHSAINFPGSSHDSRLSMAPELLYPNFEGLPMENFILGDIPSFVLNLNVKIVSGRKAG